MKVSTIGGKPLISGSKVVVTSGNPCACGDCGGPTPPPTNTGACCKDGECSVGTRAECDAVHGAYLGDGTNCVVNHCVDTTLGCCVCPDEPDLCATIFVSDCTEPCTWTQNNYCTDNGPGTAQFCCQLNPVWTACATSSGVPYCCPQEPHTHTCCTGYGDTEFCCDDVTEQCVHATDPEFPEREQSAFCCPITWTPCGFQPCCNPETDVCCDVPGSGLLCFPIAIGCPFGSSPKQSDAPSVFSDPFFSNK